MSIINYQLTIINQHNTIRRDKTAHQRIIKPSAIIVQIEAALEALVGQVEGDGVGRLPPPRPEFARPLSPLYNFVMSDYLTNPHDKFFKDLFSRQEAARDFLQHFLPTAVVKLLDLDTLVIQKDSFIDPDLHEHFSDLLYQVRLHSGQEIQIYLLFEHKSYPAPDITLQLLDYMVRIWQQARRQGTAVLPILPLVLYHGAKQWQVAPQFSNLFDLPNELRPYFPDYQYWLCDLSTYSETEIKRRVENAIILQMGLLLLKYESAPDFLARLEGILQLLWQLSHRETALEYLETILRYVVSRTDQSQAEELRDVVRKLLQEGEELMPTIAEQWFEQGKEAGLASGLEQGREEGREQGQREATLTILRRYLATRFNLNLDHFDAALQPLDLTPLLTLSERAFTITTLVEFEAALAEITTDSTSNQTT